MTPTIKRTRVCNICNSVLDVTVYDVPNPVDPDSLSSLHDWIRSRPPGDYLAKFIADAVTTVRS